MTEIIGVRATAQSVSKTPYEEMRTRNGLFVNVKLSRYPEQGDGVQDKTHRVDLYM